MHVKVFHDCACVFIGVDESGDLPMEVVLADNSRIDYFTKHLYHLNKAIK